MTRFIQQMLFFLVVGLLFFTQPSIEDRSTSDISGLGKKFVPFDTSYPPLLTFTAQKLLYCYLECNKLIDCRTFDFDGNTRQCRLWDVDTTTGSIVASPSTPQLSVGSIQLSPSTYANIYNRSCNTCTESRYVKCNTSSNTCQCPSKTFWNGSMCLAQLLRNQTCSQTGVCRLDLNLTCQPSCDLTYRCSAPSVMGVGQTVAGFCNATTDGGLKGLLGPWGIYVSPLNGTLYFSDYDYPRFQSLSMFSRIATTVLSTGLSAPEDIFVDNSSNIYMSDYSYGNGIVYIQDSGGHLRSFPTVGLSTSWCALTGLYTAIGIVVDQFGNIYVSLASCYILVKWAPNATAGVIIGGQSQVGGSGSNQLRWARFMHWDEARLTLYVADSHNNRILKFQNGSNGIGVTVAGTTVAGVGLNQLNDPCGIWVTRDGLTIYIADSGNNRVMKWTLGASQGSVIAGSASGTAGSTSQLLNYPGDVALDPTETYLYVTDYYNHRIQRFRLV